MVLADPQTSGGLLIAVDKHANDFDIFAKKNSFVYIGYLEENGGDKRIWVDEEY